MIKILDRNTIETGGFNGIIQKRLIVHPYYGPGSGVREGTWSGVGSLVYMADSWFEPGIATGLHPHRNLDVLTFVVEGVLDHEGSMKHGSSLEPLDFQVQKSGLEGFVHNEINTGNVTTRMLQLWMLPQQQNEQAEFRVYHAKKGKTISVYGKQDGNATQLELTYLERENAIAFSHPALVYIVTGSLSFQQELIPEGHLIEVVDHHMKATMDTIIIVAYEPT